MFSFSSIFTPTFFLILGIVFVTIGFLCRMYDMKLKEQNQRIQGMFELVNAMLQQIEIIRSVTPQPNISYSPPPPLPTSAPAPAPTVTLIKEKEKEKDDTKIIDFGNVSSASSLIIVSEDEDDEDDEEEDDPYEIVGDDDDGSSRESNSEIDSTFDIQEYEKKEVVASEIDLNLPFNIDEEMSMHMKIDGTIDQLNSLVMSHLPNKMYTKEKEKERDQEPVHHLDSTSETETREMIILDGEDEEGEDEEGEVIEEINSHGVNQLENLSSSSSSFPLSSSSFSSFIISSTGGPAGMFVMEAVSPSPPDSSSEEIKSISVDLSSPSDVEKRSKKSSSSSSSSSIYSSMSLAQLKQLVVSKQLCKNISKFKKQDLIDLLEAADS